ncbi:AI-2E family transporter [Pseudonocardia endophytica]|uniref:Putative PurR-regulated permease PerM n=1 Tax=Pseudonocardia endophytica TaxID=401976 RepID=A0A4R1HW46_PSEEN|nr:AI-2E family transporter [Pseudonocardia endophytica]TCK21752.1 putative PurR-regulated permease PerM [Pseudonocardia endophytica]
MTEPATSLSDVARARSRRRPSDLGPALPTPLRVAAAWGWRFLVVVAVVAVLSVIVWYLASIVVPVAIALLLAALLSPAVGWLQRHRVPRGVATAVVMLGGLAVLGGVLTFVVAAVVNGLPELGTQVSAGLDAIVGWLSRTGPLHLSEQELVQYRTELIDAARANQGAITAGALTTALTIGEVLTESLLVVFALIFFLHGGTAIWRFLLGAVPAGIRTRTDVAGRRGLAALVSYVRATAAVAVVDAVVLGIGLAVLGVPLAVPLAALVFLGAFVPILGAVVSGAAAVLVALVVQGPVIALVVLALLIAIMQLEGHVLQPLLLGRAVKLHPLAVVLAIAIGLVVAGIAGALLAVPLLAVLNSGIRSLRNDADSDADPEQIHTSEPEDAAPGSDPSEA